MPRVLRPVPGQPAVGVARAGCGGAGGGGPSAPSAGAAMAALRPSTALSTAAARRPVPRVTAGTSGVGSPTQNYGFARRGFAALRARSTAAGSLGSEHDPLTAVDQLPDRVQVTGVARGLPDHPQHYGAQIGKVQPQLAPVRVQLPGRLIQ